MTAVDLAIGAIGWQGEDNRKLLVVDTADMGDFGSASNTIWSDSTSNSSMGWLLSQSPLGVITTGLPSRRATSQRSPLSTSSCHCRRQPRSRLARPTAAASGTEGRSLLRRNSSGATRDSQAQSLSAESAAPVLKAIALPGAPTQVAEA